MKIKIGTRGSKLAMVQTDLVVKAINERFPGTGTEIINIKTLGDKVQDKPLSAIGGAGVFAGAIESALQSGEIDIAVHSAKDLPVRLGDGLETVCVLKRGNPRDVLITNPGAEIKEGAVIGTGSLRRKKSFAKLYPGTVFKDIRGNVDTRLNKLKRGEYDGIILAAAGLERLGLFEDKNFDFHVFEPEDFLCAPCQGIIAVESRSGELKEVLDAVKDIEAFYAFETERHALRLMGGDCSIPVGAFAEISNGGIKLTVTKDCEKIISGHAAVEDRFALAKGLVSRL